MTTDISALLKERAWTHGDYAVHALITQDLKRVITHHVADLDRRLDDDMAETLDMIAHKIGRIIAGNPAEPDHWRDIANYAQLVANRLEGAMTEPTRPTFMAITSTDRMRAVLRLLANEIETWAPSYLESKICHLAVTEVADRLRAEADQ